MTQLLQRPFPFPSRTGSVPPPAWLTGVGAGLLASVGGVVACMGIAVAGWLTGSSGSTGDALRVGAATWLLGHGHSLELGGASLSVVPLGLTALVAVGLVMLARAAAALSSVTSARAAAQAVAGCAASYVGVVLLVALMTSSPDVGVALGRGGVVAAVLALGGATLGVLHGATLDAPLPRVPVRLEAMLRGALSGALTMFGMAALVLTASLVLHLAAVQGIVESLRPGPAGGVVLVLVCLLVLPNVVLMTGAVMLGPGIALGVGTSVSLTTVSVAPLPALPWLAAVPPMGTQPAPLAALAALPVLAGLVAGLTAARKDPGAGLLAAIGAGGAAGLLAGVLVGAAIAVSGGSIGPGRMAEFGAPALACLAVAAGALGCGGLLGAAAVRLLGQRAG